MTIDPSLPAKAGRRAAQEEEEDRAYPLTHTPSSTPFPIHPERATKRRLHLRREYTRLGNNTGGPATERGGLRERGHGGEGGEQEGAVRRSTS
jgi:hypothetical protein